MRLQLPASVLHDLATLTRPRRDQPDSFGLHAQLEAVARLGLLRWLDQQHHHRVFDAVSQVAEQYEREGALLPNGDPAAITDIAPERAAQITLSLAAAGHAPIGFHLATRVRNVDLSPALLVPPLHEVNRAPTELIEWHLAFQRSESIARAEGSPISAFERALREIPHIGTPGVEFIQPIMRHAEHTGTAAAALARFISHADDPEWFAAAAHRLTRLAAWSMVHDDETFAPYGWTHCLTMPQGALSMIGAGVDPRTVFVGAGTFAVGFRAAFGSQPVGPLDDGACAAAVRGKAMRDPAELALAASRHEDAHLVKYTLACVHAAEDDPAWADMYLTAATFLLDWWAEHEGHTFGA